MKTRIKRGAGGLIVAALSLLTTLAQPVGQWEFDNAANRLDGAVGDDLTYADGAGGATAAATAFGTTTSFGLPSIGGQDAAVMRFPAATAATMGFTMPVNAPANGGGSLVNNWTLIMDILYPLASDGRVRGLMETDGRIENPDADFKINAANAVGALQFHGNFTANQWHRLALVVDTSAATIRKYIDGVEIGREPYTTVDGRWALDPTLLPSLFTDDNGESAVGFVSSIQFRDAALTGGQIGALAGPTAAGIPQVIPPVPAFIESRVPAPNAVNVGITPQITIVLNEGDTDIPEATIHLSIDGTEVVPDLLLTQTGYEITFQVGEAAEPGSMHTVTLSYEASGVARSESWRFTTLNYQKLTLPAPIYLENFDLVAEGDLPSGWTRTNRTTTDVAGYDLGNAHSDAYKDWLVITRSRLQSVHGGRRTALPPIWLNGAFITALSDGSLVYAESDVRGGEQVQAMFTSDYDLTGRQNVFVVFKSAYEQNQDNIAGLEYSIDEGANWHPLIYMINGRADNSDVIRLPNGTIDAVTTLNTARTDQAWDLSYGAYVAAPITQALAPFISPRIDDDQIESKRIEVLRAPLADNQPKVRFRFIYAGTASWYWGVDDFGLYSINSPVIGTQPTSRTIDAGQDTTFTVAATGSGVLSYQWQFNGNDIENATTDSYTVTAAEPEDAGQYRVIVSNADGPTVSAGATLTVIAAPQITQQPLGATVSASGSHTFTVAARGGPGITYQWQKDGVNINGATSATYEVRPATAESAGLYRVVLNNSYGTTESSVVRLSVTSLPIADALVLHLKFDGDANDMSGRQNHGTLAGQPETEGTLATFDGGGAQLIGTHALHALAGQHISLGAREDFLFGANVDFSFSFWVKGAAGAWTSDPSFVGNKHWISGGNPGFVVAAQGDGGWKWNWKGDSASSPRRDTPNLGVLTDGTWHNVVVSHDRDSVATFFVDGQLRSTISIAGDATIDAPGRLMHILQDGTGRYGFANDPGSRFVNVFMDDFGAWRRALTPQEAASIHSKGRQGMDLTTATFVGVEPPTITTPPANANVYAGFRARFTVTAAGTPPLTYRWFKDGVEIQGETLATYTIPEVTAAHAGDYSVIVSNDGGSRPAGPATLTVLTPPQAQITGQWDFDNGDLSATTGAAMEYRGDTASLTTFPSVTIGGQSARVMSFPGTTPSQGYIMPHGASPNGGGAGTRVNNYTLIMDVMFPQASHNRWRALWQTSPVNSGDGDLFVNSANGIGISGNYTGQVLPETWHRLAFTINSTDGLLTKYIDGARVGQQTIAITDGRFSLDTTALVFTDESNETAAGFANSIQFRDWVLSGSAIATLGAPTASGIPGLPTSPRLTVERTESGIRITVSEAGVFQLQRKLSLNDADWTNVGVAGPGPFTAETGGATAFFQVRRVP